jgi:hypothetical protein
VNKGADMKLVAAVLVVGLSSIVQAAQSRPNFSGDWSLVPEKSNLGGDGAGPGFYSSFPDAFTIAQTDRRLTVSWKHGNPPATFTYALDGSENRNRLSPAATEPDKEVVSRASWVGRTLVIETTRSFSLGGQTGTVSTTYVMSLDGDGLLLIDKTTPAGAANAPSSMKLVYRKR